MKKKDVFKSMMYLGEYVILVLAILVVWYVMGYMDLLNPVVMPKISKIGLTFAKLWNKGDLLKHCGISLGRVLRGYGISVICGVTLGIFIGLNRHMERITQLLIQIIKPIPPIAWIPLVILWFGIGESGKTFLIFLGGFFTILVNVVDGIKQTDKKLIEVSKVMETPFLKKIFKLIIPSAAPNIFTGLRTGLASCWMCVVAAELVSSTTGLGYMIMDARQYGQTDIVIVGMIGIGIIGKIMDSILKFIERKIIKWI